MSLHLNLLNPEEVLTSNPVRLRVMLPLLLALALVGLGVWWMLLFFTISSLQHSKRTLEIKVTQKKPELTRIMQLRREENEAEARLQQLIFYRSGQKHFGDFLLQLPHSVPADIQLIELHIPLSSAAPVSQGNKLAPVATSEDIRLTLAGRAGGRNPSEAVAVLLTELRNPERAPLIVAAAIPGGAFRLDTSNHSRGMETSLFSINCDCGTRRFE